MIRNAKRTRVLACNYIDQAFTLRAVFKAMNEDIQKQFHEEMLAVYDKVGKSTGYWPHRFLKKVKNHGGLAAAKSWLNDSPSVSEGFKRLAGIQRLDFSMEAIILRSPWSQLFTDAEKAVAMQRLEEYGYPVTGESPPGVLAADVTPSDMIVASASKQNEKAGARRLPVVSLGAEHLVIGNLMRRNILAYKAPPNNEGYDIVCIHPDPRQVTRQIRVQVKSRYQTDCDRAFPVKEKTFGAFDYVIAVFLNLGYFYKRKPVVEGLTDPEFYTLRRDWIREHHRTTKSGWQKVHTKGLNMDDFKNEKGFELIATDLGIPYPK